MKRIFLLLCISLILTSCGKIEEKVVVENKDNSQISTVVETEIKDTKIKEIEPKITVEKETSQEINIDKETVFTKTIEIPKEEIIEEEILERTGTNIVEINFEIERNTDYNNCIISKDQYNNLQEDYKWKFGEYDDLCLPKNTIIWTIKQWNIDGIDVYSCINFKRYSMDEYSYNIEDYTPYSLKKHKPWNKTFKYNIAHGFDNICEENNWNYIFKYYKDWKELKEINSNKDIWIEKIIYKEIQDGLCYILEIDNILKTYCINNEKIEVLQEFWNRQWTLKVENNNLIRKDNTEWYNESKDEGWTEIVIVTCNLNNYECKEKIEN